MTTQTKPQARVQRRQARTTTMHRQARALKWLVRYDLPLRDNTERGWFEQQVCREAP